MKKSLKILKFICGFLWYTAVIGLVLTLVLVFSAKFQGKVPSIMGYSLLRITTGSMKPAIPADTYILVEEIPADQIQKGDIISFYSEDPLIQGKPNTHRVYDAPVQTENDMQFITKGDANPVPDSIPVSSQKLIGRYVRTLDGLTHLARFCSTQGMLVVAVVILVLGSGMMAVSVLIVKGQKGQVTDHDTTKEQE